MDSIELNIEKIRLKMMSSIHLMSLMEKDERRKFLNYCNICNVCHFLSRKVLYNVGYNTVTFSKNSVHKCYLFGRRLSLFVTFLGMSMCIIQLQNIN